jgi:hypothetical protein
MGIELCGLICLDGDRASERLEQDSGVPPLLCRGIISRKMTLDGNITIDNQDSEGKTPKKPSPAQTVPESTLPGRILSLKNDGFFKSQQALGAVRDELRKRGWHYPTTSLSGPLQLLVRQRELRREQIKDGKKKIWKYSNY